jgi:hypothetical protein
MSQRWFYGKPENSTESQFVLLVDHRGSSSCRRYDSATGVMLTEDPAPGLPSEQAFASILRDWTPLEGLRSAKVINLKYGLNAIELNDLRLQAGLLAVPSRNVFRSANPGGGMLDGFDTIVDEALGLTVSHQSRTAALQLSTTPRRVDGPALVRQLYQRIERNWDRSPCRSVELWRWKALPHISEYNTSVEKTLEKAIVTSTHNWVNQIPAASGLLLNREQRHTNVDLGREIAKGHFELIELKAGINADTPLRAAFEILGYGLLYCFARQHIRELDLPTLSGLLFAQRVDLKVLGPREIYQLYALGWLETELDNGVRSFAKQNVFGLTLRFVFETFPPDFHWPDCTEGDLRSWLEKRSPFYAKS